jgi:hypothetical protein
MAEGGPEWAAYQQHMSTAITGTSSSQLSFLGFEVNLGKNIL